MIQEILKEHDDIFGYTTKYIEENEPSTNGGAGCDDCYESQKLRAKSRAFLEKSLKRVEEEAYRKGWIDGTECGAVGCKGGAEYCQSHTDLY